MNGSTSMDRSPREYFDARLRFTAIRSYTNAVKMVVASAVNKEGDPLYPRKWNRDFIDLPEDKHPKQPTLTGDVLRLNTERVDRSANAAPLQGATDEDRQRWVSVVERKWICLPPKQPRSERMCVFMREEYESVCRPEMALVDIAFLTSQHSIVKTLKRERCSL